jgi:hypothetical protein
MYDRLLRKRDARESGDMRVSPERTAAMIGRASIAGDDVKGTVPPSWLEKVEGCDWKP